MATTYNTAFGSLPGYNELLGTTNTTGGGQQTVYGQRTQQQRTTPTTASPFQTFAQMQRQGMARPAPPTTPTAQPFAQYGGSEQAQQMRQRLQQQLETYGQAPSRFDTQAFQQIRGAQAANLQQEYQAQQQQLNEELARRGLFASSIGGGRMGDLAGQQARALATLDAQLLQQAAETQAQDRAQLLQAGQGFAELAGAQDLAQFEANRVAQAATFENQLRAAQFGQQQYGQMGEEAFRAAQAEEEAQQAARQFDLAAMGQTGQLSLELQRLLGQQDIARAELTGRLGEGATAQDTLAARQAGIQERQLAFQNAARLSEQSGVQYTVDAQGNVVPLRDAQGNPVRTSAETRAAEAIKLQEAGITGTFGGGLTQEALQNAYARAAQLSQITGQQYTVNPATGAISAATGEAGRTFAAQLQQAALTGSLGGQATLERLQQNLQNAQIMSQITGRQYTVDANGNLVPAGTAAAQTETARQFDLEQALRRQLGLTEASGFIYDLISGVPTRTTQETVQGQLARSQLLMSLAQTLSGLDPDQIAQLLGQRVTTTTSSAVGGGGGGTTTTTQKGGETGVTTTTTASDVSKPPTNPTEGQLWTDASGRTFRWTNGQWVQQTTTTTAGGTTTTAGATTTTAGATTTTRAATTTTAAPTTTTAGGTTTTSSMIVQLLNTTYPYATNGIYADVGTSSGTTWYQYQNGQWVVSSPPPRTTTTDPSGTFQVSAYPGMTMANATNQRFYWSGTQWVPIT